MRAPMTFDTCFGMVARCPEYAGNLDFTARAANGTACAGLCPIPKDS